MVAHVLMRMNYNLTQESQKFVDKLIDSTERALMEIEDLTISDVNQRIGFKLELLWIMLMSGKTEGLLFEILKKMFLTETIAKLET